MSIFLGFKLALRFVRSRRKGALTRFISFASTCGIAIGAFAAIVGFSSMNGFEYELENRVLSIIPSAQLNSKNGFFNNAEYIEEVLGQSRDVVATSQAIEQKAILSANRSFAPVLIEGIHPDVEENVVKLQQFVNVDMDCLSVDVSLAFDERCAVSDIVGFHAYSKNTNAEKEANYKFAQSLIDEATRKGDEAQLEKLNNERYIQTLFLKRNFGQMPRIIIGSAIANKLKVNVGDTVDIVTLDNSKAQANHLQTSLNSLSAPQKIKALVVGLIHIGGQLDNAFALMEFEVLRQIARIDGANAVHIRTSNLQKANRIVIDAISGKLQESAYLVTWKNTQGKLYNDIQMVRQIMFIAMFLVLAVACFNIVSNLMMLIGEKRREIAIMMTMGMRPIQVVQTFSLMGIISGGYGLFIGATLGVIVSLVISPITSALPELVGFELLNKDVYFINFIPCRLEIMDVLFVCGIALFMSFVAALYPAIRAARVKPAIELSM